mmetsp:Transcript_50743/g.152821  ORF Transcript_50743/g.152821 Transcript_50743/m.152821 type:complete len:205 (+) Transcript_50743:99-713(+)
MRIIIVSVFRVNLFTYLPISFAVWSLCSSAKVSGSASLALPSSCSLQHPSGVNAGIQIGTYVHASGHTHFTLSLASRYTPLPAGMIVVPSACCRCRVPCNTSTHSANSGHCHASLHGSTTLATHADRVLLLLATFPKYSVMVSVGALTTSTDLTSVGALSVLCAGLAVSASVDAASPSFCSFSTCSVSGEYAGKQMATISVGPG